MKKKLKEQSKPTINYQCEICDSVSPRDTGRRPAPCELCGGKMRPLV
jgi:hypothetical protein